MADLWRFCDTLLTNISCLETPEIASDQYGVLLTPIVICCLYPALCKEWAQAEEGKERDLFYLLDFLRQEIELLERSQTYMEESRQKKVHTKERRKRTQPNPVVRFTNAALHHADSNVCPLYGRQGHSVTKGAAGAA